MEKKTLNKKIEILEHSLASSAGAYYSINLTKNLVPGTMYQVIDNKEYSLNQQMGLPKDARFTDVVAYWGEKLPENEKAAYYEFLFIPNLLERYEKGEYHVAHKYWTKSALFEPMLAEQHIVMYEEEETKDVLAVTYVLDLTWKYKEDLYKKNLEERQEHLENALRREEDARKYQELQIVLESVDEILGNLAVFDSITSGRELDDVMPGLLKSLGQYSRSDRAYIFTWADKERSVLRMTHEWCGKGVRPTIGEMQNVQLCDMPNWTPKLKRGEPIISEDWNREKTVTPEEYALFDGQDIRSLIVIPILANKKLNGYIGFDNPEQSRSALSLRLLKAIGGHIGGLKENLFMMEELEEDRKVLKENVKRLEDEKKILDALVIDYTAVYYCDLIQDSVEILKQGKNTNGSIIDREMFANTFVYSKRIKYYYDHFVIKESAPDFEKKLSAGHLMEYLNNHQRFVYRFRTLPNRSGQQCFEVQFVRLSEKDGSKVIMGYRYIDDILAAQEEQKIKLENALAEARLNNEIISSISKIYWLIYRMNLEEGTYEEVSAGQEMHHLTGKCGIIAEAFQEAREKIVAPEHQEMMKEFLDTASLPDRLQETESIGVEYHAANGSWHLARFIVKKRNANGRVTHVLYVAREINKQKQLEIEYQTKLVLAAEENRRANIAKTDFLRRMSHDIRTPINGIRGMVTIANHFPDDLEKQQECRDKVMEASGFLLNLVNNVLDMNKLESGNIVLERKPFELISLLQKSNHVVEMTGQENGIQLVVNNAKMKHTHLIGSPLHFQQILHNVAGNAVKYNRDGGKITLTCEETEYRDGKAVFLLTCTDTGKGMSREFLGHAFEPFAQEENSARTAYMGTGLGLTIVKQLVELMGGTIEIESEINVGTKISMKIPFEVDPDYKIEEPEDETEAELSLKGLQVLVAEDNDLNMEIAEFLLTSQGMCVTKAWNGIEAVNLFSKSEEGAFDLILMDVMMPFMNGLDAARMIRSMNRPDAKTIPIFAMTANAFLEDQKQSKEAGMNEHISKPIDEQVLVKTIQKYLIPNFKAN